MGPFFVTKRVGPVAYELELPQTWRLHLVFHTSLLRPFHTSEWSTRTQAALDNLELEEDDRSYEVERCYHGVGEGPVTGGTESTWCCGQVTQLMMLRGRLPATSTTQRNYRI